MFSYIFILLALTAFSTTKAGQELPQVASEDFVAKQKIIYELLWHVDEAETVNPKIMTDGKTWDIRKNIELFDNETVVDKFLDCYETGMLPRGEIFSIFYPHLLDEALSLIRLFKSATLFDTFYKTAAWARLHVNEGLFIYAFSIAVVHRPDTKFMRLPNPHEIIPYEFFSSDVIRQAHEIKMRHMAGSKASYVVIANESLWYTRPQGDPEHRLNYLTEDVGWNGFLYTLSLEYPFWMSSEEFKLIPAEYRGEQYYYCLKLLLVRYNLERLSNGLSEIEDINWNEPITMGYHPLMTYRNGAHFPHRNHNSMVPRNKLKNLQEMRNLEARIWDVVDSGMVMDKSGKMQSVYSREGFNILGNIIQGNADSINKNFYGSMDAVGRNILGFSPDPLSKYKILPSALEHFSTSLRDPGFYRLCKRLVGFFEKFKRNMDPYTPEELGNSSGIKIDSVNVDKLETYFDSFDSLINEAVAVRDTVDAKSLLIKARQYRLNHKPFTYTIMINAEKETDAVIRIFHGPKFNALGEEIDFEQNYANFYEFDTWKVKLTVGKNEIKRNSHEAQFVAADQRSGDEFYRKLSMAADKRETLTYSGNVYGFPDRLILPKGTKDGLPLQVFVHVAPDSEGKITQTDSPVWGKAVTDGQVMGYPLDRPMKSKMLTMVKNMFIKDVFVFHKGAKEINATV